MFEGKIFAEQKYWYFYLVFPIVQAKKMFEVIYRFLLKVIWEELFNNKTINDGSIVFLICCVISLLLYYSKYYNNLLIIGSIIIWYLDYGLAKSQYLNSEKINLILKENSENNEDLILTKKMPKGKIFNHEFNRNEVKQIALSKRQIKGGAFEEVIAQVWQIEIILMDNYTFSFHEESDLLSIFKQAKTLAEYLQVPMIFLDSEGFNKYAQIEINNQEIKDFPSTIKYNFNPHKNQHHIYYKWNFSNSWLLLKQIFSKGGFFLFILIINGLLLKLGAFLNFFINSNSSNRNYTIILPSNIQELLLFWFKPEGNFLNIIGLVFAIIIMIYQGAKISQTKHIFINSNHLKFYISHRLIDQIDLNNIETILFIKKPFPHIYILGIDTMINISEFQQFTEFQIFLIKIKESLDQISI